MIKRIPEYFGEYKGKAQATVANFPKKLHRQERDWTCSIACLRTILSGVMDEVPDENYFIDTFKMAPGPYYSKDIKNREMITGCESLFSCDLESKDITIDMIGDLLQRGYYVMVESMYNYAHWYVIMGYCAVENETNLEKHKLLIYDPYYNEVRLLNVDEFSGMWCDADNHVKEFIAVRQNR